jgi:hypothetical protein
VRVLKTNAILRARSSEYSTQSLFQNVPTQPNLCKARAKLLELLFITTSRAERARAHIHE